MRLSEPAARFTAVAFMVAALIVAQFVLLIGGGLAAGRSASRALDDTFTYLADISEERVVSFVTAAERAVVEQVPYFEQDGVSALSALRQFHEQLAARDEVASLSVTYTNGEYVSLSRSSTNPGGFSAHIIDVRSSGTVAHRFAEYDGKLRLISEHHNTVEIDPRDAPAYEVALGTAQLVWTQPDVDPMMRDAHIAVVESARDDEGRVKAVVTATIYLDALSELLNTLPAGSDGEVFLLAADRTVITVSSKRRPAFDAYLHEHVAMPKLADLGLHTSGRGTSRGGDVMGEDGDDMTLERGLHNDGVAWIIHLRASPGGLNQGYADVRDTMKWVIGSLVILTIALGYLLAVMWGPVVKAHQTSVRDPLTGLYNRRHADLASGRMLTTAHRTGRRLAVVMFDLDNFKRLNDEVGHQAGDAALAEISAVLTSEIRASDMAVRWGGDEFMAALMVPEEDDAAEVVERIRARIDNTLRRTFGASRGLGVTAGYCVSTDGSDDVDNLIALADHALIEGKAQSKGHTYEGVLEDKHSSVDRRW